MVLFSFKFTEITCVTINTGTFKCLLKFQHDVTSLMLLLKNFFIVSETGLKFILDNFRTRTTILTWITIASSRHITTFTVIFCNSIFLNAVTSITIAYTVIITRYTTSHQMAGCTVMRFETCASRCWNIVHKIDNTCPFVLTFIKITSIGITAFTKISWCASATEFTGSFVVEACSIILYIESVLILME